MSEEVKPVEPAVASVEMPVAVPVAEAVAVPEPKVVEKKKAAAAPGAEEGKNSESSNVAAKGAGIYVQMVALIPMGSARNSRSVISVQKRLMELGYASAGDEKSGYFGENTCSALQEFQKDKRIESKDCAVLATIEALFSGTAVEILPEFFLSTPSLSSIIEGLGVVASCSNVISADYGRTAQNGSKYRKDQNGSIKNYGGVRSIWVVCDWGWRYRWCRTHTRAGRHYETDRSKGAEVRRT